MYRIVRKERLHDTVSLIEVEAPYVARKALPGQFIVLRIDERASAYPSPSRITTAKRVRQP